MAHTQASIARLQQMKRDRRKIVAVVVYDCQLAAIAHRAGVDLLSVGDSVGVNLWGHDSDQDVTLDQMILACRAVRRGAPEALVSCDVPFGPQKEGLESTVRAAAALVKEGGANFVKIDAAAASTSAVTAVTRAGIPVWAQFDGAERATGPSALAGDGDRIGRLVAVAGALEAAGAALLDFRHSGPVAGPAVVDAATIPVIGGLGGGPWLDGRVRMAFAAIGYLASAIDDGAERYANVAKSALDAFTALAGDVRAGRQITGAPQPKR